MDIKYLTGLYNFAKPTKKRAPNQSPVNQRPRQRQNDIVNLTRGNPMTSPQIVKALGIEVRTANSDIRSLLDRGKLINMSLTKAYYVKAA